MSRSVPPKVHFISLGCAKNLVDSEKIIGGIGAAGAVLVTRADDADSIVINTCGFIGPAIEETEREIARALGSDGKKVFVYGCAVDRCAAAMKRKFPSVAGWFKIRERKVMMDRIAPRSAQKDTRCLTTSGYAYLKIADGCSNCCSYCTIPAIKGPFRSVDREELLREARELSRLGIKELILIGQDTTRYGMDLYGKPALPSLLHDLAMIEGIRWIRIMYAHPGSLDDSILRAIARNPKVCRYIDLPIQHISDRLLSSMNRGVTCRLVKELVYRLKRIRNMTLRTTVIAGYPGETESEFEELRAFLREGHFDYVGVFPYCREPGTAAARLSQLPGQVIRDRYRKLIRLQRSILIAANRRRLDRTWTVLIHARNGRYIGHAEFCAPDVDSRIICRSRSFSPGTFHRLKIDALKGTELYAR